MKVNDYKVLQRAIEDGIQAGLNRAHKHLDNPGQSLISEEVYNAIMLEICEVFVFENYIQE